MPARITIGRDPISFSSAFPYALQDKWLYGSKCRYASGTYGSILVQIIEAYPFQVVYTRAKMEETRDIHISLTGFGVIFHCVLGYPISITSALTGSVLLQAQSATVLVAPAWVGEMGVKAGAAYEFLTLFYPPDLVSQQLVFFPLLEEFAQNLETSKPLCLPNCLHPLSPTVMNGLYQLLHTPFTSLSQPVYRGLLASILPAMLGDMAETSRNRPSFALDDIARITAAKEWIDSHLDRHFTIDEIARKATINEYKLKKGFKALYGLGLYGYLLRQRLRIARIHLEQTSKPIHQIARQAGYKNAGNFSEAFQRQYGITPHQMRTGKG